MTPKIPPPRIRCRTLLFRVLATLATSLTLTAGAPAPSPDSDAAASTRQELAADMSLARHFNLDDGGATSPSFTPANDTEPLNAGPERPGTGETGAYVDPTTGRPSVSSVLRPFDKPAQNWLPGHRGVDLSLPVGAEVLAAGNGIVAFAGVVAGTPVVSIDHPDGIRTTYQPVFTRLAEGDQVSAGAVIGRLANPVDEWPGLHWGARVGEEYLNPLGLLSLPVIRLKPATSSDIGWVD